MDVKNLIHSELIFLDEKAEDNFAAIDFLGKKLAETGYIDESYATATKTREETFPTGIKLTDIALALPHATPDDNVHKDGIGMLRLAMPVDFGSMEDPDQKIAVSMVFLLALKSSNQHLEMLQKLFDAFQNDELVTNLGQAKTPEDFKNILIDVL